LILGSFEELIVMAKFIYLKGEIKGSKVISLTIISYIFYLLIVYKINDMNNSMKPIEFYDYLYNLILYGINWPIDSIGINVLKIS